MANHIQHWTTDRVLNEPLSSLKRGNINQRRTGQSLFLSFLWFLSCDGDNQYLDIQQISIGLWNAFNDDTKSHWEARGTHINDRPLPGLLQVWPEANLPHENIQDIVLQSMKSKMNYFAKRV